MLIVLMIIPNGTAWNQVAFIIMNAVDKLDVILGQKINARDCIDELTKAEAFSGPTRTHTYTFLVQNFRNHDWMDETGLLPMTGTWDSWREEVFRDHHVDPKSCMKSVTLQVMW